ncbi:MAG: hypothetical protein FJX71_02010 [Alphaproteobacteria bacterium]|nr:hypothetical protein [Alphaproteobacteria bacterium]
MNFKTALLLILINFSNCFSMEGVPINSSTEGTSSALRVRSNVSFAPISKLSDHFFTSEGSLPSGRKVYFGIEQVSNDDKPLLQRYYTLYSEQFVSSGIAFLPSICLRAIQGDPIPYSEYKECEDTSQSFMLSNNVSDLKGDTYSKEEYYTFVEDIANKAIHSSAPFQGFERYILELQAAMRYMEDVMFKPGLFYAYVSSEPITQPLSWSFKNVVPSFKDFINFHSNLIVTAGIDLMGSESSYQIASISPSPQALLKGSFEEFSFYLLYYVAQVMKDNYTKQVMHIYPRPSEKRLLNNHFTADGYVIDKSEIWDEPLYKVSLSNILK